MQPHARPMSVIPEFSAAGDDGRHQQLVPAQVDVLPFGFTVDGASSCVPSRHPVASGPRFSGIDGAAAA